MKNEEKKLTDTEINAIAWLEKINNASDLIDAICGKTPEDSKVEPQQDTDFVGIPGNLEDISPKEVKPQQLDIKSSKEVKPHQMDTNSEKAPKKDVESPQDVQPKQNAESKQKKEPQQNEENKRKKIEHLKKQLTEIMGWIRWGTDWSSRKRHFYREDRNDNLSRNVWNEELTKYWITVGSSVAQLSALGVEPGEIKQCMGVTSKGVQSDVQTSEGQIPGQTAIDGFER